MIFLLVKQLNPIVAINILIKINCNLCMYKGLIIINIYVIDMLHLFKKYQKYMGSTGTIRFYIHFSLALIIPPFGEIFVPLHWILRPYLFKTYNGCF